LAVATVLWGRGGWIGREPIGGRSRHGLYRLARAFVKEKLADRYPDDVGDLLVQAFLEDLRRAYRRWTPWGAGRRRTGYPWLLVDGVSDATAGKYLIDAIGRARNATADAAQGRTPWRARHLDRIDPLLVVAAGEGRQPADAGTTHPADAPAAYRGGLNRLGRSGGWTLPFDTDASVQAPGEAGRLSQLGPLRLRRAVAAPLVLALFAAALVVVPFVNHARCDAWWSPSLRSPLIRVDADCVGVSDNPLCDFVPDSVPDDVRPALRDVYSKIMATNEKVAARPDAVTIVNLSVLTPRTSNTYRALVEELRGAWLAQNTSAIPIRMVLANGGEGPGGRGLVAGDRVANKIIELAAEDSRVVAVAGIPLSTGGAQTAIRRLGSQALPVIGTLTSADDMANINEYYHQVGPNNLREARVAALYASRQLGVTRVSIFYSGDESDRYSRNLAEDAKIAFAERGIQIDQYKPYRAANDEEGLAPFSLGQGACPARPGYAVFYAGRSQYLEDFLLGMNNRCGDHSPPIIADDSVTRSILEGTMTKFPNVHLDYLSFANPAAWRDCAKVPYYKNYLDAFGGTCQTLTDGRSAAGYDAM